jgi:hypothetical protein
MDTGGKFSIEYIGITNSKEVWRKNVLDLQGRVLRNSLDLNPTNITVNLDTANFVHQGGALVNDRTFAVDSQRSYKASIALVQTSANLPRRVSSITLGKRIT